jgi:hypothetical protein
VTLTGSDPGSSDEHFGRRRLSRTERLGLLDLAPPAVFSTIAPGGWVHSVPVHFTMAEEEIRMISECGSAKVRHVRRTGRATLCVVADVEDERRYVTVEGSARTEDAVTQNDLSAVDRRYRNDSGSVDDEAYVGSITLVLRPERWIGRADSD